MQGNRFRFIEVQGESRPLYVVDDSTGQRYHLVPLPEMAPDPKEVPARFRPEFNRQRQTCKVCGLPGDVCYDVTDEAWERIVPKEYSGLVVCLTCFDLFAEKIGADYAECLRHEAFFVGKKASVTLLVETSLPR